MGLSKRFKFELVAEWRAQCVQYKGLQRLAEDVLGLEGHEREAALCLFMSKATLDMRKVENVYVQQETRIALTAQNLSAMIGSLCENVMDKVAAGKFPHDSPESITSLPNALAVVATFLARVDALRTFAVLNVLAMHKILRRNCDRDTKKLLHAKLKQFPWHMQGKLAGLLSEVEDESAKLYQCLCTCTARVQRSNSISKATVVEIKDAVHHCDTLRASNQGSAIHHQRPSCASTSCAPHGLGDAKGIQAHARAASVSDESQEPAKWRVLADAAFHAQRIRSPTETSAVAEQGWGFTDAASSGAVKGNAVALYDHNPWCATSKDFNLYCGMCSQRAQNVVEVGPHLCCWQCVALEHDQDFLMVCGGNYDMRAVAPARALDRFVSVFGKFLPDTLREITTMSTTQQLLCLANFVRTIQGSALCGILLHPQPRIPVLCLPRGLTGAASTSVPTFNIPRIRILVADDDPSQRLLLKKMLSGIAWECEFVENGALAIEKTAQIAYDLVLMDGFMPVKDGWQASREICTREKKRNRSTLIIGVTGATDEKSMITCRDSGMRDVVPKPVNKSFLLGKIMLWISQSQTMKARLKTSQAKGDLAALAVGLEIL